MRIFLIKNKIITKIRLLVFLCSLIIFGVVQASQNSVACAEQNLVTNNESIRCSIKQSLFMYDLSSTIPNNFIEICRLLMITNPLDLEKRRQEINTQQSSVKIPVNELTEGNPTGLQKKENREIFYKSTKGRNVVLTQYTEGEETKTVMIVTGLGPRWTTKKKNEIAESLGMEIVDIIDVLPIEMIDLNDDLARISNKIKELYINVGGSNGDIDIFLIERKEELETQINEVEQKKITVESKKVELKKIEEIIRLKACLEALKICQTSNNITELRGIIRDSIIESCDVKECCFTNKGIIKIYAESLKKMHNSLGNPYQAFITDEEIIALFNSIEDNFVKNIADITPQGGLGKDRGAFSTKTPAYDSFLSYISHSEPLYLMWRLKLEKEKGKMPSGYFFTQRDMCEGCNVTLLNFCKKNTQSLVVLSGVSSQRPGRQENAAVDQIINYVDDTWQGHGRFGGQPGIVRIRLPDLINDGDPMKIMFAEENKLIEKRN